jgi:hypothetical protein
VIKEKSVSGARAKENSGVVPPPQPTTACEKGRSPLGEAELVEKTTKETPNKETPMTTLRKL